MAEPSGYTKRGLFQFTPLVVLSDALVKEVQTTVDWSGRSGFIAVDTTGDPELESGYIRLPTWAKINNELVAVTALVDDPDGAGQYLTMDRGVLDTVPQEHAAGVVLWFCGDWIGVDPTEWVAGETVWAKAALLGSSFSTPLDKVIAMPLPVLGRAAMPYPPGAFKINGIWWPATDVPEADIVVSWAHRDRLQQTVPNTFYDQAAGDIGPEANTTYTLRFYGQEGTLLRTETGLTDTTYTYVDERGDSNLGPYGATYNTSLKVELESVRDGVTSFQHQEHTVTRTLGDPPPPPPNGLLAANFETADYSYNDGDYPHALTPDAVQNGVLVVRENTADIGINNNKLRIINTAESWTAGNVTSTTLLPRALGQALFFSLSNPATEGGTYDNALGGFANSTALYDTDGDYWEFFVKFDHILNGGSIIVGWRENHYLLNQVYPAPHQSFDLDTDYEFCIVLGGYNSSRELYEEGQPPTSFDYGAFFFIKGGTQYPNWTLLHSCDEYRPTPNNLYATFGCYDMTLDVNNILATDFDYTDAVLPVVLDHFDDTNGTLLPAHTPDIRPDGAVWEKVWSQDIWIQNNRAECVDPDGHSFKIAKIETGKSDVFIDLLTTAGAYDRERGAPAFRFTDDSNFWLSSHSNWDGQYRLAEIVSGSYTTRFAINSNTYVGVVTRFSARLEGPDMVMTMFDGSDSGRFTYSSAANQTATKHGFCFYAYPIYTNNTSAAIPRYSVHALGTEANEYNILNAYST